MSKPMIYEPIATNTDVPRDIRDRFADILNVKDYGAVGDGNTNDTQSFKNAKAAANTKNTAVYVPYGTYKITENIADNQVDISANAHTFLTDGHVTITGGGSVNVLDLSKAITTDKINPNDIITSNHFDDGKNTIYLNSSGQVDIHYNGGLQPITSGGIQYLGVKGKEPITVDSEGVGLKYEPDEFKVTDGGLTLTHPFDGGSYLPTSGGTMNGAINFSPTSGNDDYSQAHYIVTSGNKFTIGVGGQYIDIGQGLFGSSSFNNSTMGDYDPNKTYLCIYNQDHYERRVAFIDEIGSIVNSILGGSGSVITLSSTTEYSNPNFNGSCYLKKYMITESLGFIDGLIPYSLIGNGRHGTPSLVPADQATLDSLKPNIIFYEHAITDPNYYAFKKTDLNDWSAATYLNHGISYHYNGPYNIRPLVHGDLHRIWLYDNVSTYIYEGIGSENDGDPLEDYEDNGWHEYAWFLVRVFAFGWYIDTSGSTSYSFSGPNQSASETNPSSEEEEDQGS